MTLHYQLTKAYRKNEEITVCDICILVFYTKNKGEVNHFYKDGWVSHPAPQVPYPNYKFKTCGYHIEKILQDNSLLNYVTGENKLTRSNIETMIKKFQSISLREEAISSLTTPTYKRSNPSSNL